MVRKGNRKEVLKEINTIPQDTWTDLGNSITETAITIGEAISSVVSNMTTKKNTKIQVQTKTQVKTKDSKHGKLHIWFY